MTRNALICLSGILLMLLSTGSPAEPAANPYEKSVQVILADLSQHKTDSFNKAVDVDAILDKTFDGLILDDKVKSSIHPSLKKAIQTKVANTLVERIPEGGYAKLLKMKPEGNLMIALVRFDFGTSGSGYFDMHLVRSANGSVKIVDWVFPFEIAEHVWKRLKNCHADLFSTFTPYRVLFAAAYSRTPLGIGMSP